MKKDDNTALGNLFHDIRSGYTLYGCFARLVEKGFIDVPEGTLRQNYFASKKIKKFSDVAALIDELFGSDQFAQWLINDQYYRPLDPEASILRGMKEIAVAAGTTITEAVMQEMKQKAHTMAENATTAYQVFQKKGPADIAKGVAEAEQAASELIQSMDTTEETLDVDTRSQLNVLNPELQSSLVVTGNISGDAILTTIGEEN